jgi:hypothetical protein
MREIDALDRALKRTGQTITLRKINGTAGLNPTDLVGIPAAIRGYTPEELTSDITQQDSKVIISPTQINTAVWPGIQVSGQADIRIPSKNRGDLCFVNGVKRAVQAAVGIYVQDVLVRIEAQVR